MYDVGYGKPPLYTRFRKGQSGNPKGRGTRNFATILLEAMTKPVIINENGKRKEISKFAAAAPQLANDAARGDKKSIQLAIAVLQAIEPMIEAQRPKEVLIYSGVLAENDRTLNIGELASASGLASELRRARPAVPVRKS